MGIFSIEEFFISIVVSIVFGKQSGECIVLYCVCRLRFRMVSCQGGVVVKICGFYNGYDIYIFGVVNRILNKVYIVDLKIYYLVYIFLKIFVYYINV